nr:hypothetical protein [Tanacetum cinerariifolium]
AGAVEADFDGFLGLRVQRDGEGAAVGTQKAVGGHAQRAALNGVFGQRAHRLARHQAHRHRKPKLHLPLPVHAARAALDGGAGERRGLFRSGRGHRKPHIEGVAGGVAGAIGGGHQVAAIGQGRGFVERGRGAVVAQVHGLLHGGQRGGRGTGHRHHAQRAQPFVEAQAHLGGGGLYAGAARGQAVGPHQQQRLRP